MAKKKITQLDPATSVNSDALFPLSQEDNNEDKTFKGTIEQLGDYINKSQDYNDLDTTSKKIVGAINEVLADANKDIISSIDTPAPIMTFNDGGDNIPVNKLLVAVTAQQAGSGTPAPDNVRAITGWSSAKITRCGKNYWPFGDITSSENDIPFSLKAGTYNLSGTRSGTGTPSISIRFYYADGTSTVCQLTGTNSYSNSVTLTADVVKINKYISAESLVNVQLETGDEKTTFEAYKGIVVTIPFGDTYYGGVLDVVNGKLTVTHKIWQASGATAYGNVGTSHYAYDANNKPDGMTQQDFLTVICDKYQCVTTGGDRADGTCYTTNSGAVVFVDDRFTSLANAQSILSSETPQVVYELATPVVINLTPEQIATLSGLNNIYADCGDIQLLEYFNENADEIAELHRSMSDDFHIYSTAEQVVGKWLGEDLYEKSYHYTQATVPAQGTPVTIDSDTSGLNIASMAMFFCTYKIHHISGNYDQWISDSTSTTQINNNQLLFYQKATSQQQNYSNLEVNITIRYTKAS